ncbi:MAG TPA: nucleoside transporter C-terminal domain-containing protein [Steroidobacteraceae bacterium]|nr:nucleoside transporter C-terminal domain-containing protein [Steroidobacteraceae bacterium]
MSHLARGTLGVATLLLIAWLLSERRRLVAWRFVALGMLVQALLAAVLLKIPFATTAFAQVDRAVMAIQHASQAGSSFVFGFLGGGPAPYQPSGTGSDIVLAFRILPLIIVVSALAALLTYWRLLPAVVTALARVFERILGIGGAVALCSVASPFLGMVESSILIRPYVARLTRSELCMVMCTGLATIAGTVLVLYATMLGPVIHNSAGHLLIASIISLPAAIVVARMLIPEDAPPTPGKLELPSDVHGTFDAISQGTRQGLALFLNIVAVLLVFVALIHLLDALLSQLPEFGGKPVSLERFIGLGFTPVAWLIGIPWNEAPTVGALLGTKTVLNELLAYTDLAALSESVLSERSRLITTYALCGFANFGSVGILVTGLATMAPARRAEIAELGVRALIGGTLANCITAALVGTLL